MSNGNLKKKLDSKIRAIPKKYLQKLSIENFINNKLTTDMLELIKALIINYIGLHTLLEKTLKQKFV